MNARHLATLAAAWLAISALSGCSAGGNPTDSPAASPVQSSLVPSAVTIAGFFGIPEVPSPAESRETDLRIESLVAECMAEQGWEYVPVVYPDEYYGYPAEDELERRQREGYNVANYEIVSFTPGLRVDPWADWVDPNAAYVESLSAQATDDNWVAYHDALDGDVWVQTDTHSGMEGGCISKARDEVNPPTPEPRPYDYEIGEIKVRVDEVFELALPRDSRMQELEATWSACMHDAGYEFASNAELWAYVWGPGFQDRVSEILGDDFFQNSDDALNDGVPSLSDDQRAALELVRADEIEMAVAAYPCDMAYAPAYEEAYAEVEAEFVNDHRGAIEAAIEKAIDHGLKWDWVVTDGIV